MTTIITKTVTGPAPVATSLAGGEVEAYLRAFRPRSQDTTWAATELIRVEVLRRMETPPFRRSGTDSAHSMRMVGARLLLNWLKTFDGDTWQQRWNASPAAATSIGWTDAPRAWGISQGRKPQKAGLGAGLLALVCADAIRPSIPWLASNPSPQHAPGHRSCAGPRRFCTPAELMPARGTGGPARPESAEGVRPDHRG